MKNYFLLYNVYINWIIWSIIFKGFSPNKFCFFFLFSSSYNEHSSIGLSIHPGKGLYTLNPTMNENRLIN